MTWASIYKDRITELLRELGREYAIQVRNQRLRETGTFSGFSDTHEAMPGAYSGGSHVALPDLWGSDKDPR